MKKLLTITLTAILAIAATGCSKDNSDEPLAGNMQKVELTGVVNDTNGNPLSGVKVSTGTKNTTTDSKGKFSFSQAEVVNKRAILRFEKSDYFTLTRSGVKANEMYIEAVMSPKGNSDISLQTTFNAANGATLQVKGMKVVLPPDAMVKADGSDYSGTVKADMRYLTPNDKNFSSMMPGDNHAGVSKEGSEVILLSFGIVRVELSDTQNNPLRLKSSLPAEVTYPIPAGVTGTLPATVPVSTFNKEKGIWEEKKIARLQGTGYVVSSETKTTRASSDDDDELAPLVPGDDDDLAPLVQSGKTIQGKVVDCDGKPVAGAGVYVNLLPAYGGLSGLVPISFVRSTTANGEWAVRVPENAEVTMIAAWTKFASDDEYTEEYTLSGGVHISRMPCKKEYVEFLPKDCSIEWYEYKKGGLIKDHIIVSWKNYGRQHRSDNIFSSRHDYPVSENQLRDTHIYDHEARIHWLGWIRRSDGEQWFGTPDTSDPGDGTNCSNCSLFNFTEIHNPAFTPVKSEEAFKIESLKKSLGDNIGMMFALQKDPIIVAGKSCKVYLEGTLPMGIIAARYCYWEGLLMKAEGDETGTGKAFQAVFEVKNITLNPGSNVFSPTFQPWF